MAKAYQSPIELFELICGGASYRNSLTPKQQLNYIKFCMDTNVGDTPFNPDIFNAYEDAERSKQANWSFVKQKMRELEQPQTIPAYSPPKVGYRSKLLYAVAAVIGFVGAIWFIKSNLSTNINRIIVSPENLAKKDIQPAKPRATLILADHSTISLDTMKDGATSKQGQTVIRKVDSDQISYSIVSDPSTSKMENTIYTPRAGFYQVRLPDNTMMYLNAESQATYPVSFTGKTRVVKVKGEVYFEVARDGRPFLVKTDEFTTEVLGTRFNINTYGDGGKCTATLLDGSIEITKGGHHRVLKPGQQAVIREEGDDFLIANNVDTAGIMSWKNKIFTFENQTLPEIVKEISRWYNKTIVIAPSYLEHTGEERLTIRGIPRTVTLEIFLDKLAYKNKFVYSIEEQGVTINKE